MKILILDMNQCTGCKICALTCSINKEGIFDTSRSRIQVFRDESNGVSIPFACEQCEEPVCIGACPANAIEKDMKMGVVKVNSKLCVGCGSCVEVCPYKGVRLNPKSKIAIICDLCGGEPLCVEACLAGAITYVDYSHEKFKEKMENADKRVKAFNSAIKKFGGN